jgi:tetratricopeptide (TPR) repeat protein
LHLCAPAQPAPGGAPARIITRVGAVQVQKRGAAAWQATSVDQALFYNDRVRTLSDGRATVELRDLSRLRLEPRTEVLVAEVSTPPPHPRLQFQGGRGYFLDRNRPREIEVETPVGAAAIVGTEFVIEVDSATGATVLTMIDGEVLLSNPMGAATLRNGERGLVQRGQPPRKTALVAALNAVQWFLYYPGVLDTAEIGLDAGAQNALAACLAAYGQGDLLGAMSAYPSNRAPSTAAERLFLTSLRLSTGRLTNFDTAIEPGDSAEPSAKALAWMLAAVRHEELEQPPAATNASQCVALSYYLQSRYDLAGALAAALRATAISPRFGFACERVAELEFSFGRIPRAERALGHALALSPKNAQAHALRGFLWLARDDAAKAEAAFDRATELDPMLGNAWLGRGLGKIHAGHAGEGRSDLETAAILEPSRWLLRSYLGKACAHEALFTRDKELRGQWKALALKELELAKEHDPFDPTPWLYSALMLYNDYRISDAIEDLEKSAQLNDNRQVYRSRLLLDEDQAVRSANLADIYKDVNMIDVSLAEAARAVSFDYANFSAHLNLASTFDALRDPTRFNLRYESEWFNELLLASMLAPPGAVSLSQNLSQQEYSRLFAVNAVGLESTSEFFSDKEYRQTATQYGTVGKTSWAFDLDYEYRHGDRINNDLSRIEWYSRIKQQITPEDSFFFLAKYEDYNSGDQFLYYDQSSAQPGYRFTETQTPLLLAGWHHEEGPGSHTLFLAGRLENAQHVTDASAPQLTEVVSPLSNPVNYVPFDVDYENQFQIYTAELNQILQREKHTDVFGARVQGGTFKASALLDNPPADLASLFPSPQTSTTDSPFWRVSAYEYHHWEIVDGLMLIGGLAYDFEQYPANFRRPPLTHAQTDKYHLSPKAALVWNPVPKLTLRAVFSRALGGVSYDESVRLEPTQLAGFDQSFRSIISESLIGSVEAGEYQIAGGAVDWRIFPQTWLTLQGQTMSEQVDEEFGYFQVNFTPPAQGYAANTLSDYDYHETTFDLALNQIVARNLFLQAQYQYSISELKIALPTIPATPGFERTTDMRGDLGQLRPSATWQLPNGLFARGEVTWYDQLLGGSAPTPTGRSFVQANLYGGYRFPNRRCDLTVGVLNLGGGDYHLSPINYYLELPHQRLFYARARFNF